MDDVRERYAQQIDAARQAMSRGDRPAAAEALRSAIDVARGDHGLQRDLASALVHLGKLEQEFGRPAEAEHMLGEALEIGERLLGVEHPSLCVVLNELSRLHIRQSNHGRAKAVLERLLRITRTKGEDHPDVATALAGLAVVHRGLGDHAAAENRYRDALRIREKVLAPNHMAIVVTLEQLSETCVARGNLAEALALLQRALPTREAALGSDHATVQELRSRIASLELRNAKVMAAPAIAAATPAVQPAPAPAARSSDPAMLYQPEPRPSLPVPLHRERFATPARFVAVGTASPTSVAAIAAAEPVAVEAQQMALAPIPSDSAVRMRRKRSVVYSVAGLSAAALAISVLALRTSIGSGNDETRADAEQAPLMVATTADGSSALGSATRADAARRDSVRAVKATLQLLAQASEPEKRSPENVDTPALPNLPAAPKRLAAVAVPTIAAANVDSLVRASTKAGRESLTDQFGSTGALRTSPIAAEMSGRPPLLIAPSPVPYFPDALRSQRTEGEVVVRFRVDEHGRVDMSSVKTLKSDHELFTLAVRNVLPRFRFEPARSPAPESKPRADWVEFRAEFTARN